MTNPLGLFRLHCLHCAHDALIDLGGAVMLLRSAGHLRRGAPDAEMVLALAPSVEDQVKCTACGASGVRITTADEITRHSSAIDDDGQLWPNEVRNCEQCRKPIPPERLEILPKSRVCAACQGTRELGDQAHDYCPRCGAVLTISHTSRQGMTRYQQQCHACGYRD